MIENYKSKRLVHFMWSGKKSREWALRRLQEMIAKRGWYKKAWN